MSYKVGPFEFYLNIRATAGEKMILKAANIEGAHHWRRDREELNKLRNAVQAVTPGVIMVECHGTDMRVRGTRVSILQDAEGIRYEVREDLGYGYKVIREGEEVSDCDCELSMLIRKTRPNFPYHDCGKMISVVSTRVIESADISSKEQLQHWINGRDIHATSTAESMEELTNLSEGECCPDFGCCSGVKSSSEARRAYHTACREGDEDKRSKLLMGFLCEAMGDAAEYTGKKPYKAYIAGSMPDASTKLN